MSMSQFGIILHSAADQGSIRQRAVLFQAAVQLVKTLLQSNPFAAKLQTESLEQKLAEEREKLRALEPPDTEEPLTQWANIQPKVNPHISRVLEREREKNSVLLWGLSFWVTPFFA